MQKPQEGMIPRTETRESKIPLYARPMHPHGYLFGRRSDGGRVEGATYSVGEKEYVLINDSDGKPVVCEDDSKTYPEVKNKNTVDKVLKMVRENHEISEARTLHAEEVAKGDSDLKNILVWHMDYENGPISDPIINADVAFYKVGRNASHDFYAGTKDGKKYAYSVGEGGWDEKNDVPIISEDVREVQDWSHEYMGHY